MNPQDADDAIREGEPPFRSGPVSEANSTANYGFQSAVRLVMFVVVCSLQVVAVLIAVLAALAAYFALACRFELDLAKRFDVKLGGVLALAVILFFLPNRIAKPVQCVLVIGAALLAWLFVSSGMIALHEWADRLRAGH